MAPPGLIQITWKNCLLRPYRSGILVLCITAVVGLLISSELIDRAGTRGVKTGINRLGADLVALPWGLSGNTMQSFAAGTPDTFYMKKTLRDQISAMDFVAGTSAQLFIKSLSGQSCCSTWNIFLIGFDPETDFIIKPWLKRNRNLTVHPMDILAGPAVQAGIGESLKFYGQTFTVAGILDTSMSMMDRSVFIPFAGVYKMIRESAAKAERTLTIGEDDISVVLIKLKPEQEGGLPIWKAAYKLETTIKGITIIQPRDIIKSVHKNLEDTLKILQIAGYTIWPITALLIGLVFAMVTHERRREIGVLRAMGARRGFIFQLVIFEAAVMSCIGAALGGFFALAVVAGLKGKIGAVIDVPFLLPDIPEIGGVLVSGIGIAILTGMTAAAIPAFRACLMEPYEAIRKVD